MTPDTPLSPHFQLSEFLVSQAAARAGLSNEPTPRALANLKRLALLLEQVRTLLGDAPILVSSGYRSPAVNNLVGGSLTSAHMHGLAADFICPRHGSPRQVAQAIADSPLQFDQLIFEGSWVHLAAPERHTADEPARRTVLTAVFASCQPTRYAKGILA